MTIEPENTFALVIGIEQYSTGPDWNLSNPAPDGERFVRWLLKKGVPPDNILFFLTPLYPHLKLEATEAITDKIRAALIRPDFKGAPDPEKENLLYFFWSGHGVADADDHQCLVCSDARLYDPRVFNLETMRKKLRTEAWAGFQRQVFVIDACATYYRNSFTMPLSPIGLPAGDDEIDPEHRPNQFVIAAASPGQAASADSLNDTGRFFNIFNETLDRMTIDGLLPDMEKLSAAIRDGYEKLKAEGKLTAAQAPFINMVDWGNSRLPLTLMIRDGESAGEAALKTEVYEKIRRLKVNLNELRLHYKDVGGRLSEANTIASMVSDLADLPSDGVPRLLQFVARVALYCEQPDLDTWLDGLCESGKLECPALIALRSKLVAEGRRSEPPYYLFISIPSQASSKVTYWVYDRTGRFVYKPEAKDEFSIQPSRDGVKHAINTILGNPELECFIDDLRIELFVSDEMLMIEADQWSDPHDQDYNLGARYCLALRWRDRADSTVGVAARRWKEIAAIIRAKGCELPRICWTAPDEPTEKFSFDDWKEPANLHAWVGFSFNPFSERTGDLNPLLLKALNHGVPFALWVRRTPPDWDTFMKLLDVEVVGGDLDQAPERLRKLRRKKADSQVNAGNGLALFWDDPMRNPFEYNPKLQRTFTGAHDKLTDPG